MGIVASRVLNSLLATQRGQATLPNLEIGLGASRVLTDLLGDASGGKPPFPTLRSVKALAGILSDLLGNSQFRNFAISQFLGCKCSTKNNPRVVKSHRTSVHYRFEANPIR